MSAFAAAKLRWRQPATTNGSATVRSGTNIKHAVENDEELGISKSNQNFLSREEGEISSDHRNGGDPSSPYLPESGEYDAIGSVEDAVVEGPRYWRGEWDAQLSSFDGSDEGILARDVNSVKLKLKFGEYVTHIGQYSLRVEVGSVLIYGATLHAGLRVYEVFAPSTHALPDIRCISPLGAVIELISRNYKPMRLLGRLSPLYERIWNCRVEDATKLNDDNSFRADPRSFSYVGHDFAVTPLSVDE